ncbi:MAG: PP2C family protein-serine/threonine phosphatase, partial [Burkholderiales bacterium]
MINLSSVLEMAIATHPGMVRSHNEDSIAADAEIGLAVLADGMGGYNAGEVASG